LFVEDAFQFFQDNLTQFGYPILFLLVIVENTGIPVPGETAVLASGFLASPAGGHTFSLVSVILVTIVAAILGDNFGFWLGHGWARKRLLRGQRFLFLTPKMLTIAEGYFERFGLWTIFFARFITGIRVVGAMAAGTAGMPWWRFLVANATGAVAWAITMSLLGYFFGHLVHSWLSWGGWVLLALVVLVGLGYYWHWSRRTKKPADPA
jgi:membrane protein DedA with SNARE-associated domain